MKKFICFHIIDASYPSASAIDHFNLCRCHFYFFSSLCVSIRNRQNSGDANIRFYRQASAKPFLMTYRPKQCFLRLLVCKLLNEKPKEGRNRSPTSNLSQPSNPRPTRFLGSYSSPIAIGFSLYEIQSLQLSN
jgi:hypothetical protein